MRRLPPLVLLGSLIACGPTVDAIPRSSGAGVGGAGATSSSTSTATSGGQGGSGGGPHVTVFVQNFDSTGAPNVPVVVNDASGAVVSQTATGQDGKAIVLVPAGGLVAAYPKPGDGTTVMQAVVDPPDGSTLYFITYADYPTPGPLGVLKITASGYPANVTSILFYACNGIGEAAAVGPTTTATVDATCFPGLESVLAFGYDAAMNPVSWGFASNAAASPGKPGAIAMAVDQTKFQPVTDSIAPILGTGEYAMTHLGFPGNEFNVQQQAMSPGSSQSFQFTLPALAALPLFVQEDAEWFDGTLHRRASRGRFFANVPPSLSFDPTTLTAVNLNPVDTSEVGHPKVSWTTGPGPVGDLAYIGVGAAGPSSPNMGKYRIYLKAGSATSFRLPDVPAELKNYQPASVSSWDAFVDILDSVGADDWTATSPFTNGQPSVPYNETAASTN